MAFGYSPLPEYDAERLAQIIEELRARVPQGRPVAEISQGGYTPPNRRDGMFVPDEYKGGVESDFGFDDLVTSIAPAGKAVLAAAPIVGKVMREAPAVEGAIARRAAKAGEAALDMSHAARMKRAEEMGFDTGKTWFHGTKGNIENFDPSVLGETTGAPSARKGFFFSSDASTASDYANIGANGELLRKKAELAGLQKQSPFKVAGKRGLVQANSLSSEERDYLRQVQTLKNKIEALEMKGNPHPGTYQKEIDLLLDRNANAKKYAKDLERKISEGEASNWSGAIDPEAYSKNIKSNLKSTIAGIETNSEMIDALRERVAQGQNVIPTHLKTENPYVHDFDGAPYRDQSYNSIIRRAKQLGHDSVILKNTYDPADPKNRKLIDVAVVLDPSQIRSVNAAFDPKKKKSGNILAGAAAAAGAGIAAQDEDNSMSRRLRRGY